MKNITTTFTFLLLLFSGFISCNSQETGGPYILKMRLKPGDKFKQDMEMKMNLSGTDFNTNMVTQEGANFEVLVNDAANKSLKITYTHLLTQLDKNMPGQENGSDSLSKKFNDRIRGKSVIVKLGPGNKITAVTGLDENFAGGIAGPGDEDIKALFDKEELNNTFGIMLGLYPEKPVKKGERWNAVTNMGIGGLNIVADRKYTLQSVKNGIATITFKGTVVNVDKPVLNAQHVSMTLNGTIAGTIQINVDDGYMRKGDFKMDMTGLSATEEKTTSTVIKVTGNMIGK